MSADASKASQTIDSRRLLRPQTRVDLIIDVDFFTGQSDVRNAMILDINEEHIIASQTEPQILKSRSGQTVEATVVHFDQFLGEATRWGWPARILGLSNDYRLNRKDPNSSPISVIYLSLPPKKGLSKTNVRQAYRLEITLQSGIGLELPESRARVNLVNFSAGGLMLNTEVPPPFALGQELQFKLTFPATADYQETVIRGKAMVVRLEYEPGDQTAKTGLKFLELSSDTNRAMEKVINYYMLEEQRRRNRIE